MVENANSGLELRKVYVSILADLSAFDGTGPMF